MGARSFLWDCTKKSFTAGLIALTISDRYASIAPVRGLSMHPTFNPGNGTFLGSLMDDCVLVEKLCLEKYKFSHGDVVVFRLMTVLMCSTDVVLLLIYRTRSRNLNFGVQNSPSNYKEKHIKRLVALPGDWIRIPDSYDALKIPEGHCWVEGDNLSSSLDSRSFGPIPMGLLQGKASHIVWPPQRFSEVERKIPDGRLIPY